MRSKTMVLLSVCHELVKFKHFEYVISILGGSFAASLDYGVVGLVFGNESSSDADSYAEQLLDQISKGQGLVQGVLLFYKDFVEFLYKQLDGTTSI
ncbi:hypothetical protein PIB30_011287 [Stylosanthes scabra]|uniref:Uncharacterized protein n=1 Tax=Stylosanthes scabra TaxID=79078 RepID=A0ABU6V422_9FABA|nr:hypothetical protein [Stylosanthes scabra]